MVRFFVNNWRQFALFYGAAFFFHFVVGTSVTTELVIVSGLLLFMHVIPTLGLPFKAFDRSEKTEKWMLTYLVSPSAGALLAEFLGYSPTPWAGIFVLHCAYLAALSFWGNSIMSREFSFKRYLATKPDPAEVVRLVQLQLDGESAKAHDCIQKIVQHKTD